MLLAILLAVLILDQRGLLEAELMLLLTFVAFFIFAGNLAQIEAVDALLKNLLSGREYLTALLLSSFTVNGKALLLGVNIGGLRTPIASLASLISLKLYSHSDNAHLRRFLLEFMGVNLLLLLFLSVFQTVIQ